MMFVASSEGFRVEGLGFRVSGLGLRVQGSGPLLRADVNIQATAELHEPQQVSPFKSKVVFHL